MECGANASDFSNGALLLDGAQQRSVVVTALNSRTSTGVGGQPAVDHGSKEGMSADQFSAYSSATLQTFRVAIPPGTGEPRALSASWDVVHDRVGYCMVGFLPPAITAVRLGGDSSFTLDAAGQ